MLVAARCAGVALLLAVAVGCGTDGEEGSAADRSTAPTGPAVDLSAPGFHDLPPPPLSRRGFEVRVWTGDELVIWGGIGPGAGGDRGEGDDAASDGRLVGDGATLDLDGGRWTPMPPSPFDHGLYQPAGAWDGHEVVVVGTECLPDVPPLTLGTPPPCPRGPAAAAWDPTTGTWRTLPPPPIPLDPFYDVEALGPVSPAVGADGVAVFNPFTSSVVMVWDRDDETWSTVEAPWPDRVQPTVCADHVRSQLLATTPVEGGGSAIWSLRPGAGWTARGTTDVDLTPTSPHGCGNGRIVTHRYDSEGSAASVIDVRSGEAVTEPGFEPTSPAQLRTVWVHGRWLVMSVLERPETVDPPSPPTGAGARATLSVRHSDGDGDSWHPIDHDLGVLPVDVGVGVVSGPVGGGPEQPLTLWRAPPELTGG